jgi:hypothetical protein
MDQQEQNKNIEVARSTTIGLSTVVHSGFDMAEVTYYVALPFAASDCGIAPQGYVGALAFSRRGDPSTGEFRDAKVIRKVGDIPDDLSEL